MKVSIQRTCELSARALSSYRPQPKSNRKKIIQPKQIKISVFETFKICFSAPLITFHWRTIQRLCNPEIHTTKKGVNAAL